ncbi:MAG: biopolymer transporter ExbD [Candidatus Omnitrophica bacterium]|nr:biopolymer transporter ExbD [Candidatus Omnitrophota bacterium]MBU4333572.1 biopolymer transporter ExbD [Candidatus Omnitrophota bacterium]
MKFKRHTKLEHGLEQIDIAPLIDVIFQLLVFFMLSSSFTFQSGINVKLPKAVTSDIIKEENLIITITSENIIYLNSKISTLEELNDELEKIKGKNNPILIKADRRSSVGRIVDVWDLCRNLGIERINIATNQDN